MSSADSIYQDFSQLTLEGPLTPVTHDTVTDEQHDSLDEQIIETFGLYKEIDDELAILKPSEAAGILQRHPSIENLLRKAWKESSFKQVRQLAILKKPGEPEVLIHDGLFYGLNSVDEVLESAWHDNYVGENHKLLLDNINAIQGGGQPYSNQITIVQSSGTGKSRMVHEQAKIVFTIPFNLRESIENKGLAFPPPDEDVRAYLVGAAVSNKSYVLKAKYLKFFASLFTKVNGELDAARVSIRSKSAEELAKLWANRLQNIRTSMYKAAIVDATKATEILPDIQKQHDKLLAERRSQSGNSSNPDDTHGYLMEFAAAKSAKTALEKLIMNLESIDPKSQGIKVIVYFDEAHSLTKETPRTGDGKTLYDYLCSCLNEFLGLPMFAIFLSTNSSLAQFAAPPAFAKSARIRQGAAVTHAPITETPFDCYPDFKVKPGELTVKDISEIKFMAKFGRPLFWTFLRGAGVKVDKFTERALELARAKLICYDYINANIADMPRAALMAVLDVQYSLDFEPRREKVQMQEAGLVESHMRVAYSIPSHREYLRSGYPSEPLLAEAAAEQLWTWRGKNPFVAVEKLTDILDTGLLDRGELGELTGRQILLDAYHRAVEEEQKKPPTADTTKVKPPNFSSGCHLITFIKMLFTDGYAQDILDCTPDLNKGGKFKDAFKDAIICFTHFGKMADNTGVTSAATWVAFIRHMAIMCRNGQDSVDCIIPVLLQGNAKVCEHVMTAMLVQFKRRVTAGSRAELLFTEANLNFFPKILKNCDHGSNIAPYRPYLCLFMELGVQPPLPEIAKTPTTFQPGAPSSQNAREKTGRPQTPPPKASSDITGTPSKVVALKGGQKHHPSEGHTRYSVFAYGCSPTVYKGITNDHAKNMYAHLLSIRNFLGEHPRKDAKSVKAVRRMKPFWTGGEDSYHWVEHDDVLHNPIPVVKPGLEVGIPVDDVTDT
ncbi:hypothetical protein CPB84DRAFT_1845911 [Gymnopilus junonius]|uniref:Uncharacterized protein n=1 Tax=Gymnopilus junonius TaxID=109634 RepID=A0A9P5NNA3_GYMJU|nr:hypothetical protein CPB84DRAFT_1845911 [Gymnopilus junonius]